MSTFIPLAAVSDIEGNIGKIIARLHKALACPLTEEDVLQLVIRPAHQDLMREAAVVVRESRRNFCATIAWEAAGRDAYMAFKLRGNGVTPFLLPHYATDRAIPPEGEALTRLRDYQHLWGRESMEASLITPLMRWMLQNCRNLQQMRNLCDGVLSVLPPKLAEKVPYRKHTSTPMPSVPLEVRDACERVNKTLLRAALIPRDIEERGDVRFEVSNTNPIKLPWGETTRHAFDTRSLG